MTVETVRGPHSQKPRLVRLDSTTASHGITVIAHSHRSELVLVVRKAVLNVGCGRRRLYSFCEQTIVWHSNHASRRDHRNSNSNSILPPAGSLHQMQPTRCGQVR